ncbi:MAG: serine hydrolase domain-containing protein [Acidobacteriota bacterium]
MSRRLLIAALAALFAVQVPLIAADDLALALFERYLDALRRQAGVPGMAAAIVGETDIVWERGFGMQDIERSIAATPATPFQIDGLTQALTAELVLRCAEEGRVTLNDRAGAYDPSAAEPDATLRQLLTHTSGPVAAPIFNYDPQRLKPMMRVVRACESGSYRKTLANLFDRLAMRDSVPGPDVLALVPPAEGIPEPADAERYKDVLGKLAKPYAVDRRGRATPSSYSTTELGPDSGAISTVRDLAEFDLAIRRGDLLKNTTIQAAWTPPVSLTGQPLPHGMGWFVQYYKGEPVIWQFGVEDDASSALLIHMPSRRLTFILLANSDKLVRPFPLEKGDVSASPFGRLVLRSFIG